MRHLLLALLLLSQGKLLAQIRLSNKPYQSYFKEVQVAQLPEPEKRRGGYVFFITQMKYYADSIPSVLADAINRTKQAYYLTELEIKNDRFYNYRHELYETTFREEAKASASFTDTVYFHVLADRYQRYWSWRSFSKKERFVKVDTVYTGKLAARHYFEPSRALTQELKSKDAEITLYRNGKEAFRQLLALKPLYQPFTFSDPLLQELSLENKLNYSKCTMEIGKKSETLIIYFPLLWQ